MPINEKFLEKYTSKVFVETGSFKGDTIQLAYNLGHTKVENDVFKEIYSIEIMPKYYNYCKSRFINNKNVHLFLGDSRSSLKTILEQIHTKATFWLDGHYFGPEVPTGTVLSPLQDEIDLISKHFIKNHTILIDDVRLWKNEYKINPEDIVKQLKSINPGYTISFEDGIIDGKLGDKDFYEKDVLVAKF